MNSLSRLAMILAFMFGTIVATAEDKVDLTKGLAYPELEVAPLASERLLMEAKSEKTRRWKTYVPMLTSSAATLAAALMADGNPQNKNNKDIKDNNEYSVQAGMLIGGGWLATHILMATSYTPYMNGFRDVKKMPAKTKRDKIARERIAEEALYRPARLGQKLTWFSALSNFVASLYIAGHGNDDVKVMGSISALAALAPIFFPYSWIDVADQHKLYKKKIYGPVAGVTLLKVAPGRDLEPGLGLTYSF